MRRLFQGLPPVWDAGAWFRAVFSRRPHPVLQFIRYGVAGVAAMAANVLFFTLAEQTVFPVGAAGPDNTLAPPAGWAELGPWFRAMADNPRVFNYFRCNVAGFLMANVVAYVLNFAWVFQAGRHARHVEIALFFGVSFVAFVFGTALAGVLVGTFGINEYVAKSGDVVAAILINYLCRKFLIFHG